MARSTRFRKARFAAWLATATMTVASAPVLSAVVCFTPNAAVPVTTSGIYVNLFNGVIATAPASAVGWDFNPWGSGTLSLYGAAGVPSTGFVSAGGVISALPAGTLINASSTFSVAAPVAAANSIYRAGVTPSTYLGVRFVEGAGTYYGWITLTTTATTGLPATLNQWCFENTGAAIIAGTTPVALQSYSVD